MGVETLQAEAGSHAGELLSVLKLPVHCQGQGLEEALDGDGGGLDVERVSQERQLPQDAAAEALALP